MARGRGSRDWRCAMQRVRSCPPLQPFTQALPGFPTATRVDPFDEQPPRGSRALFQRSIFGYRLFGFCSLDDQLGELRISSSRVGHLPFFPILGLEASGPSASAESIGAAGAGTGRRRGIDPLLPFPTSHGAGGEHRKAAVGATARCGRSRQFDVKRPSPDRSVDAGVGQEARLWVGKPSRDLNGSTSRPAARPHRQLSNR